MAYTIDSDGLQDLRDAIDALEEASTTPAKSRARKVSLIVDEICEHVYQFGFHNEELLRVIQLITTKTELDQSSITTSIKNLYPADGVSSDIVIAVVGALGQGGKKKPSASTQAALVKWLAAIHEVLEDHSILMRFYAVLFNLLDMISIRIPLCHLLGLITRRKHVRPFRIQRLLSLLQQAGSEPALTSLLRVYKNYCPDIIVSLTSGRSSLPSQSNPEWRKRMLAIQDVAASQSNNTANHDGFRVARNGAKRSRVSFLPEVHTFHAKEASMTIEEVESVDHFVENLERIEPPSELIAGLRDPLLQKFLMMKTSIDSTRRLEFWLLRYFEEELETLREGFGLSPSISELLAAIVSYTESSKNILPVAQQFLTAYLPLWNGASDLGAILDLFAYLPVQNFSELYRIMLSPLEQAILQGAHSPFDTLFDFYGNMAQSWGSQITANSRLVGPIETAAAIQSYVDLVEHVSTLAQSSLAASEESSSAILGFYEAVVDFAQEGVTKHKHLPIIGPPPPIVYLLLMSSSLSILSRICSIIVTYKLALGNKTNRTAKEAEPINGYLMDVCNLLWRSRALELASKDDPSAKGCLCPAEVSSSLQNYLTSLDRDYRLQMIFGLSFNPTISSVAQTAFAQLQDESEAEVGETLQRHAGPVTERSLNVLGYEGGAKLSWKHCRVFMLNWMEEVGVDGVKSLLFATLKNLMTA